MRTTVSTGATGRPNPNGNRVMVPVIEPSIPAALAERARLQLQTVKRGVTPAISKSHIVRVADFVLAAPDLIPITTSGKVRRAACVERYRQDEFSRVDVTV